MNKGIIDQYTAKTEQSWPQTEKDIAKVGQCVDKTKYRWNSNWVYKTPGICCIEQLHGYTVIPVYSYRDAQKIYIALFLTNRDTNNSANILVTFSKSFMHCHIVLTNVVNISKLVFRCG